MPHIWNYFETENGKGEHDGVAACIKNALRRKEMEFTTISLIRYANTIVAWCSSVMGQGARRKEDQSAQKSHVHRYFGIWSREIDHTYMSARLSKELVHSI